MQMDENKKVEKGIKKLEMINQWITNCDAKTSFLLTFYGVIITIIMTSKIFDEIKFIFSMSVQGGSIKSENIYNFLALVSICLFIKFSAKSFYFIYNTLKARIDPNIYAQEKLKTNSNIFFFTIASKQFNEFHKSNIDESIEEYIEDIDSQIYINSCIATLKFQNYNKSIECIFWGLLSFAAFIFFILL